MTDERRFLSLRVNGRANARPLTGAAKQESKGLDCFVASLLAMTKKHGASRHCEPPGRTNARPMTGSAKQSRAARKTGLLRRLRSRNVEPDSSLREERGSIVR